MSGSPVAGRARPAIAELTVPESLRPLLGEAALGRQLSDAAFTAAMTHRSFAYENGGLATNERLEFLGDAVLGLVITDVLYREHPEMPESQLAPLRSSVVNMRALAEVARTIGLGDHVRLGKGEESTGGRDKASILADALEALIGSVHQDLGLAAAATLVRTMFDPVMAEAASGRAGTDWKTALQELTTARGLGPPDYEIAEAGPDHAKRFRATALVRAAPGEEPMPHGRGEGGTKKEAEQLAAREAHALLATATATTPSAVR